MVRLRLYRQRHERIRYFQPHGGQEDFLRLIAEPGAFIVVSGAGNGWGKSEILAAIFAAAMWPKLAAPCFAAPAFSDWKYPKRARIYSKPAELEEIGSLQTAIAKLFPKGRYLMSKGRYGYPSVFKSDTGWVLDMFSYERHESEAAGPNIGLQGFNEPPPEPLWKEAMARARAGGLVLGAMTSLLDNPWVVDGIFGRADGQRIRLRYGDVEENCVEHGKNGNLEHARIEQILASYDPDEREARKTGRPLSLSGAIFKGFNREVHVVKHELVPPEDGAALYQVVDPAIGKPLAVLWAWVDLAGVVHVYDELPEGEFEGMRDDNTGVLEYVQLFKAREAGRRIETRILDRHFGNARRTMGGQTLKQEFAEAGDRCEYEMGFIDSYSVGADEAEVETGIRKVKGYLHYDRNKPIDALNRPRLVISPKCRNTIAAMERWGRNPKTGRPKEEYKDFADLVRYLCMAEPSVDLPAQRPASRPAHYGVGNA